MFVPLPYPFLSGCPLGPAVVPLPYYYNGLG